MSTSIRITKVQGEQRLKGTTGPGRAGHEAGCNLLLHSWCIGWTGGLQQRYIQCPTIIMHEIQTFQPPRLKQRPRKGGQRPSDAPAHRKLCSAAKCVPRFCSVWLLFLADGVLYFDTEVLLIAASEQQLRQQLVHILHAFVP
jgi:hypothetical protein